MNPVLSTYIFWLNWRQLWSRGIPLLPIALAVVVAFIPFFFQQLALGQKGYGRISNEVTLNIILYCGLALAIYLGSTSYRSDLENKTLSTLVSHPISRLNFHLGKFMAEISLLFTAHVATGTLYLFTFAAFAQCDRDYQLVWASASLGLGAAVVYSFCYACSTRCSPALAAVLGASMFILCSVSDYLLEYFTLQERDSYFLYGLAGSIRSVLPKMMIFDINFCAIHLIKIPDDYLFCSFIYATLWVGSCLLLASYLTSDHDL